MVAQRQAVAGGGRRARQAARRPHRLYFTLTDQEFELVCAAADRHGLSRGAYAGAMVVAAAEHRVVEMSVAMREALTELIRSAGLVRRAGVNLNQAVTRLNATGQPGPDLEPAVNYCGRVVRRLDEAAELVRRRLP